jgi:formylglycine-generating enzyme required for sulfatase activity
MVLSAIKPVMFTITMILSWVIGYFMFASVQHNATHVVSTSTVPGPKSRPDHLSEFLSPPTLTELDQKQTPKIPQSEELPPTSAATPPRKFISSEADFPPERRENIVLTSNTKPRRNNPIVNSIGMKFEHITEGTFLMGSPPTEKSWTGHWNAREQQHEVRIRQSFYMAAFETTQREFQLIMGFNPSSTDFKTQERRLGSKFNKDQLPVTTVDWDMAVSFCQKLSGLPAEKSAGRTYRLPTEAEWEYACRAGTTTAFHFGDNIYKADRSNCGSYPTVMGESMSERCLLPVGMFPPNAWGLYDMHGNVTEWCSDIYSAKEYGADDPWGRDMRMRRGGAWAYYGYQCRSAWRGYAFPHKRTYLHGFRVVLEAPPTSSKNPP